MTNRPPSRTPLAGGLLFAIGALVGPVIGLMEGQPTLGFLIGIGVAAVISILLWLRDHRSA